jgi:hypothetical protein
MTLKQNKEMVAHFQAQRRRKLMVQKQAGLATTCDGGRIVNMDSRTPLNQCNQDNSNQRRNKISDIGSASNAVFKREAAYQEKRALKNGLSSLFDVSIDEEDDEEDFEEIPLE